MASIFNLFGDIAEGSTVNARAKSTLDLSAASVKNVGQLKPKGLSIRSKSDLNVPTTPIKLGTPIKKGTLIRLDTPIKPQELLTPKHGQAVSPSKSVSQKKVIGSVGKLKDTLLKKPVEKNDMKSPVLSNETIFKKPLTPRNSNKKWYLEREMLAPYCDMQYEFDYGYIIAADKEFKELLKRRKSHVVPYTDVIESENDRTTKLVYPELPELNMSPKSPLFSEEFVNCKIPLPEISDDDVF